MNHYQTLRKYYQNKFGERVLKICVNGGFTCPNRDGTCGTGGCIFCGESGSGEHLSLSQSIEEQIHHYLQSYRGTRANKFIVYFQNFSNTYDTISNLKKKYDSAFIDDRIIGISIATRPDCITDEIASLLNSYTKKFFVSVELGFQTSNEETAQLINRGYSNQSFVNAVSILKKYPIEVVTHMMIGLPNETQKDIANTIQFLNQQNIQGIKIHSTYVLKGTKLSEMYLSGEYIPLTLEEYIHLACFSIANLRSDIIIHRISGDAPKDLLIVPKWNIHKKWIINGIEKYLKENDLWQGKYVEKEKNI